MGLWGGAGHPAPLICTWVTPIQQLKLDQILSLFLPSLLPTKRKVLFSHVFDILSTGGGGVVYVSVTESLPLPPRQRLRGQRPPDRDPQTETSRQRTPGQRPPPLRTETPPPPPRPPQWAVCILLECILVPKIINNTDIRLSILLFDWVMTWMLKSLHEVISLFRTF